MRLARERVPGLDGTDRPHPGAGGVGQPWPHHRALGGIAQAVTANLRLGDVMPLLSSATGRCFAAYMPPEAVAPLLQQELAQAAKLRRTDLPATLEQAQDVLADVRERGMARVVDTLLPGIVAVLRPGVRCGRPPGAGHHHAGLGGHVRPGMGWCHRGAPAGCGRPAFPPTWALAAHEPLRLPPGLLHCQGPLMPRRTLWILTALVLAVHWLVLQGVPLAWDGSAAPAGKVFTHPQREQRRRLR